MLELAWKFILIIRLRQVCVWGCSETKLCSRSDSVGVGLQIHLHHTVASNLCLGLYFLSLLLDLGSSSDGVGVGLQIHLDHKVASGCV